jgi:hypothetical protein
LGKGEGAGQFSIFSPQKLRDFRKKGKIPCLPRNHQTSTGILISVSGGRGHLGLGRWSVSPGNRFLCINVSQRHVAFSSKTFQYDFVSLRQAGKKSRAKLEFLGNPVRFHPVDISWWNRDSLIISRVSGALSVLRWG